MNIYYLIRSIKAFIIRFHLVLQLPIFILHKKTPSKYQSNIGCECYCIDSFESDKQKEEFIYYDHSQKFRKQIA
jgi:hypothetical protein